MTAQILLRTGDGVLVDDGDYELLCSTKWRRHSNGYAAADMGPRGYVFMHRMILGLQRGDGQSVDHINGNRLDNRRCNLRVVSHAQNCQNRNPFPATHSGHRGVSWDRARNCWRAHYMLNGRQVQLGRFQTVEEAALVVATARAEAMGHTREPLLTS